MSAPTSASTLAPAIQLCETPPPPQTIAPIILDPTEKPTIQPCMVRPRLYLKSWISWASCLLNKSTNISTVGRVACSRVLAASGRGAGAGSRRHATLPTDAYHIWRCAHLKPKSSCWFFWAKHTNRHEISNWGGVAMKLSPNSPRPSLTVSLQPHLSIINQAFRMFNFLHLRWRLVTPWKIRITTATLCLSLLLVLLSIRGKSGERLRVKTSQVTSGDHLAVDMRKVYLSDRLTSFERKTLIQSTKGGTVNDKAICNRRYCFFIVGVGCWQMKSANREKRGRRMCRAFRIAVLFISGRGRK